MQTRSLVADSGAGSAGAWGPGGGLVAARGTLAAAGGGGEGGGAAGGGPAGGGAGAQPASVISRLRAKRRREGIDHGSSHRFDLVTSPARPDR